MTVDRNLLTMTTFERLIETNRFTRMLGRDRPAAQVLAHAVSSGTVPVTLRTHDAEADHGIDAQLDDYALIDPALALAAEGSVDESGDMLAGTGYAGMTPQQRTAYLAWLQDPSRPAPPGFQDLYLATLEVRLFEGGVIGDEALLSLRALQLEPAWRRSTPWNAPFCSGFGCTRTARN